MISTHVILLILSALTVAVNGLNLLVTDKRRQDVKALSITEKLSQRVRELKKKKKKKKSKKSKSSKSSKQSLCTNKSQEDALLAFKAGITSDPNNVMADWITGGSVCNGNTSNWSGITCVGNLVTKLELDSKDLSGTLSPLIGCLFNLTVLDLGINYLSGSIPSSLGSLKALTTLKLDDNNFSGPIPLNFSELTSLNTLILYTNNLTGEIPASLGDVTNLRILDLEDNNFSGTIPSTLGNLSMLQELYLSFNMNITGTIPTEVCNLTSVNLGALFTDCSIICSCCTDCY